jgi:hypothetical protein
MTTPTDDLVVPAPPELWTRVAALTVHEAATRKQVLRSLRGPLLLAAVALVAATATVTATVVRVLAPEPRPAPAAPAPGTSVDFYLEEDRALLQALDAARPGGGGVDGARLDALSARLRGVDAELRGVNRTLGAALRERARVVEEIRTRLGTPPQPPRPPRAPEAPRPPRA